MHKLAVMVPDMPDAADLRPYLERIDRAKWYTNGGPLVRELEGRLGHMLGAPTVCTANATLALQAVLRSLGSGLRVLVPSVTFVASLQAIVGAGHTPVVCDVDPHTWCLTPEMAEEYGTGGVEFDVVMPVAAFGLPVDTRAWSTYAKRSGDTVVIDAAAALPNQSASNDGSVIVCTSLHATKFIGAAEGGTVSSTDAKLLDYVRSYINFGIGDWPQAEGTNAKMSEYHAAAGLASMEPAFLQQKAEFVRFLRDWYFAHLPSAVGLQDYFLMRTNHTIMPVVIPANVIGGAERVKGEMEADGIETRRWYAPMLHARNHPSVRPVPHGMPVAEMLNRRLLGLPFHCLMDGDDVQRVCKSLRAAISD